MSAALVESVRAAVDADARLLAQYTSGTQGARPVKLEGEVRRAIAALDLPAILAALTEAEALRAQVVAGQAREYALVEALGRAISAALHARPWIPEEHVGARTIVNEATAAAKAVLNAPTDTAALRAMLEAAVLAGGRWVARRRDGSEPLSAAGYAQEAADERVEELGDPDDPDTKRIVDRVLGGS